MDNHFKGRVDPLKENFQNLSEEHLAKRMSTYNLNQNEKQEVWQVAKNRDQSIQNENADFKKNYNERLVKETDKLRGQQQARSGGPKPGFFRTTPSDKMLAVEADKNVRAANKAKVEEYKKQADKKITQILNNAQDQGRGPKTLTQEFNYERDRNR